MGFRPRGFLNKKVILKKLELEDVLVDAHPMANGSMNYQYLIDAFATPAAEEPPPPPKPKPGKPWDIVLPNASIGLHRIDLRYDTPDSSMVANGHIGQLDLAFLFVDIGHEFGLSEIIKNLEESPQNNLFYANAGIRIRLL